MLAERNRGDEIGRGCRPAGVIIGAMPNDTILVGSDDVPFGLSVFAAPSPRAWLVFCHGFKGFRRWGGWSWLLGGLAERGVTGVSFDFSHAGVAPETPADFSRLDLFERNSCSRELFDLAVVVRAAREGRLPGLESVAGLPLVLVGHSKGGGTAILGSGPAGAAAVVGLASVGRVRRFGADAEHSIRERGFFEVPNARTGQIMRVGREYLDDLERHEAEWDLVRVVAESSARFLFVHGTADASVPIDEARALAAAGTPPRVRLAEIEGADHTFGTRHPFEGATDDFRRVRDLVAEIALD